MDPFIVFFWPSLPSHQVLHFLSFASPINNCFNLPFLWLRLILQFWGIPCTWFFPVPGSVRFQQGNVENRVDPLIQWRELKLVSVGSNNLYDLEGSYVLWRKLPSPEPDVLA